MMKIYAEDDIVKLTNADWDKITLYSGNTPGESIYCSITYKHGRFAGGIVGEKLEDTMHWEDIDDITAYDVDEINDAYYSIFAENMFKNKDLTSLYFGLRAMDWDLIECVWDTYHNNSIKVRFDILHNKTSVIINNKRGYVSPDQVMPTLEKYLPEKDIDEFIVRIASRVDYTGNLLDNYALDRICLFRDESIDDVVDSLLSEGEYWSMGAEYHYDDEKYENSLEAIKAGNFKIWDESDPDTVFTPNMDDLPGIFTKAIEKGYRKCVNNFVHNNEDFIDANILTQIWFFDDIIYG